MVKLKLNRISVIILAVLVLIAILAVVPRYMNDVKMTKAVDRVAKEFAKTYHVDNYYKLGSATNCASVQTSSYGDIGHTVCTERTAIAYYPRITVSSYVQQPEGLANVVYNTGPNARKPQLPKEMVIKESGISYRYQTEKPGYGLLNKYWNWDSDFYPKVAGDPSYPYKTDLLANKIESEIFADKKLASGTPTTTEALESGRAPLILYIDWQRTKKIL